MKILETQNIVKQFENHRALSEVSISVEQGTIFGLLGPNGAGKTTLIRIINQITAPDEGNVFLFGEKLKPEHIKNIGYLPTATAHGEKTRLAKPVLVKFYLKKGELISGNKITFIPALKGSGSAKKVEWLVHAPAGTKITLKVISETAGRINRTVTLK